MLESLILFCWVPTRHSCYPLPPPAVNCVELLNSKLILHDTKQKNENDGKFVIKVHWKGRCCGESSIHASQMLKFSLVGLPYQQPVPWRMSVSLLSARGRKEHKKDTTSWRSSICYAILNFTGNRVANLSWEFHFFLGHHFKDLWNDKQWLATLVGRPKLNNRCRQAMTKKPDNSRVTMVRKWDHLGTPEHLPMSLMPFGNHWLLSNGLVLDPFW